MQTTIRDLEVDFGATRALAVHELEFSGGELVAVMGPNGSGKTTLLTVLAGLTDPTGGSIDRAAKPTVAYVAQHHQLHKSLALTVGEVLKIGRYRGRGLIRRLQNTDREAIEAAAQRLGVADLAEQAFANLSGGQRQRVLIASALAQQADLLLLDEPITGLDLPSQEIIVDVMQAERDAGRLVVFTTHHLEEARQADRVLLVRGTLVADGAPHDVLQADPLSRAFGHRLLADMDCEVPGHVHAPLLLDDHGHGDHHHGDDHSHHGHAHHDAPGVHDIEGR